MWGRSIVLMLVATAGLACVHREHVVYRDAPVDRHEGWVRLGERSVDGRHDRDVIHVGRREGAFRKIMIAVERNPIELHHVVISFEDGSTYAPTTRLIFGANTRSGVIDLPGSERIIRNVEFQYGSLPGTGRAEVELWGR